MNMSKKVLRRPDLARPTASNSSLDFNERRSTVHRQGMSGALKGGNPPKGRFVVG
jgi:hypothetical protein